MFETFPVTRIKTGYCRAACTVFTHWLQPCFREGIYWHCKLYYSQLWICHHHCVEQKLLESGFSWAGRSRVKRVIFMLCRPGCRHVSGWIYLCSNATQHPFKTWTMVQQKL